MMAPTGWPVKRVMTSMEASPDRYVAAGQQEWLPTSGEDKRSTPAD